MTNVGSIRTQIGEIWPKWAQRRQNILKVWPSLIDFCGRRLEIALRMPLRVLLEYATSFFSSHGRSVGDESAEHSWSTFRTPAAKNDQVWPKLDKCWLGSGQDWPILAQIGPSLAKTSRMLANTDRNLWPAPWNCFNNTIASMFRVFVRASSELLSFPRPVRRREVCRA